MAKLKEIELPAADASGPAPGFGASLSEAQKLLDSALPNLKCPVCNNDTFVLVRHFKLQFSPKIPIYAPQYRIPTGFVDAVAVHCDDCGHFLFFSEDELLKRAERKK